MSLELFLQSKKAVYEFEKLRNFNLRLDRVWSNHLNTMTEKRDKFGRRVYIFRLGEKNHQVCNLYF